MKNIKTIKITDNEYPKLLKEIYNPHLKVLHHHNVSTNLTHSSEFKKVIFMNENIKKSLEEFLKLMEKDKKEVKI